MKHLTIIYPEGQSNLSTIACIAGTIEIFERANEYYREQGKQDLFRVELAGTSRQDEVHKGLFTVHPQASLSDIGQTDLIIIPSTVHHSRAVKENELLTGWIRQQYKHGAAIATMCSGAFLLAASGLLDGRNCSTHWAHAETFRNLYPRVHLQADRLITDEHGICTNGGAYSFLNLVIYLVEKYYDRQTAIYCSKIFQVEMDRNSQSEFVIFNGQKMHGDEMVQQAQAYIEGALHEKVSVEELAGRFAVSRRNFDRRFIKATGNTPGEYAQRVKIESAKKAMETTRKTINEVMYDVGYTDVKAFREVFRKVTGMSPLAYREKYNKEAAV